MYPIISASHTVDSATEKNLVTQNRPENKILLFLLCAIAQKLVICYVVVHSAEFVMRYGPCVIIEHCVESHQLHLKACCIL
jgi:hypothetical protein